MGIPKFRRVNKPFLSIFFISHLQNNYGIGYVALQDGATFLNQLTIWGSFSWGPVSRHWEMLQIWLPMPCKVPGSSQRAVPVESGET